MFPRLVSLLAVLLCCTIPLEARVIRVEVSSQTDVLNGQQFGEAGAYERIVGRVYFSVAVATIKFCSKFARLPSIRLIGTTWKARPTSLA
jgi:hypothetical protein